MTGVLKPLFRSFVDIPKGAITQSICVAVEKIKMKNFPFGNQCETDVLPLNYIPVVLNETNDFPDSRHYTKECHALIVYDTIPLRRAPN